MNAGKRMFTAMILGQLTWIGVGLGILYWVSEAALEIWTSESTDFVGALLPPSPELWKNLLVLCTLTAFGLYAQALTISHRRIEDALQRERDSAQKYLQIVDTMVVALDATGKVTLANPKACTVLGCKEGELVGKDWFATCLPARIQSEVRSVFDRLMAGEVEPVEYFENPILTQSGEERLILWHNSILTDEAGHIVGTLSSGEDITERKRAERALEQRAAQLALLNDIGGEIATLADLNSVLERAARLVQERFGYHHAALFTLDRERGELVMRARAGKFAHLFPPDHHLKSGQGMVGWAGEHGETLLANDVNAEPRYVNLYPDVIPTKSELSVPIRVGENVIGVLDVQSDQPNAFSENDVLVMETLADQIAVAIENAHLYEAVRAGEESERRFREQLGALHEVGNELSKAPTFDDLCRQAVELGRSRLGFDRLGVWFLDEDPQFMVGSFGTDEQGQLRDERGIRLPITPGASARILIDQASVVFDADVPLRNDQGKVVGRGWEANVAIRGAERVIGYISADNLLSGRPVEKHQLEVLKLFGATLGHLCTRKRAEEALAQKARELSRSNADLEYFAYITSHDLQEPLRMVSSYLQLLERRYKDQLDADAREFIAYAVDGASRMQTLINALLSYSRVGTRGKPFVPTDCSTVLERTLTNLKVAIEENDAVVTHDPLPTVMADEVQLARVFQNLIGNAIKFHGERPPQVHVGAQRGKGEWVFSVRDNGIGIDPQHFERIFMIFQRLHSQDEYPGTGIGLAICKRIVERHGGRIWVESQPGQGSTFYFTIPDKGGAP